MQELDLTLEQAFLLIGLLIPVIVYQWRKLSRITYKFKPKTQTKYKDPSKLTNDRYGAVIQLHGRYYN